LITLKALLEINSIADLIKEKPFFAFLSLAIILLDLFIRNDAHYVGRATLGVTLLVATSYIFLMFMSGRDVGRHFPLLLIITVVIAYTYYTAFIATFIIVTLYILSIYVLKFSNSNTNKRGYTLTLASTLLFLIIIRPFLALVRTIPLSPGKFIDNLMDWILSRLGIERGEAIEFFGEVPIDLFTRVSTVWLGYAIRLFSIFTFALYLINRIIINKTIKSKTLSRKASYVLKPGDIYAIIVIGATIAELLYTFLIPIVSLRYITMFSVFYIPLMLTRIRNSRIGNVIATLITLSLILLYAGTCRSVFIYGKVGTAKYISGISSYISLNGEASSKTVITGDSYYTGYLWFMHIYNNVLNNTPRSTYGRMSFTVLDKDIYDLFNSHNISRTVYCIKKLVAGSISTHLVIINDGKPIRGTAWGFMTLLSPTNMKFLINNLSVLYNDINSLLLELRLPIV
jgi:hypothetical protein